MDGKTRRKEHACGHAGAGPVPENKGGIGQKCRASGEQNPRTDGARAPFRRRGIPRPMAMAMDMWKE